MNENRIILNEEGNTKGLKKGQKAFFLSGGVPYLSDFNGNLSSVGGAGTPATSTFDVGGAESYVNSQPWAAKKIAGWLSATNNASPPIFMALLGDSFADGLDRGPYMGFAGFIGLGTYNISGTVTQHAVPGTSRFDYWINGRATTHDVGSVCEFTLSGSPVGDIQGDKVFCGFINKPGGGTFDLEYSPNGDNIWTPVGTSSAKVFTVNAGTDIISSTAHGFSLAQGLRMTTTTTLPAAVGGNITAGVTYFVIPQDANSFKLARSAALAKAGTAIDFTDAGTGTHTATSYQGVGIDTVAASLASTALKLDLPTSTAPFYRVRVTNVTGSDVTLITMGIYKSQGGGVVVCNIGKDGGIDITSMITTSTAVFNPIWSALAPDVVLGCWADGAAVFSPGGAFETLYNQAIAASPQNDWILVGPHVTRDGESAFAAQAVAQRAWAQRTKQSFVNARDFLKDWDTAAAQGLVNTVDGAFVHLSAAGKIARNLHIWRLCPFFQWNLGQVGGPSQILSVPGYFPMWEMGGVGTMDASLVQTRHGIRSFGANGAFILGSRSRVFSSARDFSMYVVDINSNNSEYRVQHQGQDKLTLNSGGYLNVQALGIAQSQTLTGTVTLTVNNNFMLVDATSGSFTITLPTASASPGKLIFFKKITAANTVTLDGAGSETIDGALTLDLTTQWSGAFLYCNGTAWFAVKV